MTIDHPKIREAQDRIKDRSAQGLSPPPRSETVRWEIDWRNPNNDPLRRAILGLGPKRPFRK